MSRELWSSTHSFHERKDKQVHLISAFASGHDVLLSGTEHKVSRIKKSVGAWLAVWFEDYPEDEAFPVDPRVLRAFSPLEMLAKAGE